MAGHGREGRARLNRRREGRKQHNSTPEEKRGESFLVGASLTGVHLLQYLSQCTLSIALRWL